MKTVTSSTIEKFDALKFTGGYVEQADNGTTEVRVVALQDNVTAGDSAHDDILCLLTDGVQFLCDTNSTMAQNKVGTYVDLANCTTIDENTTADNVFYVTEMVGETTNKKCKGFFVMKTN